MSNFIFSLLSIYLFLHAENRFCEIAPCLRLLLLFIYYL